MTVLDKISFEFRFIALFALLALVISLFVGLASGVELNLVFLRLVIVVPIFAGMGFAVAWILKRYIPELYNALNSVRGEEEEVDIGEVETDTGNAEDAADGESQQASDEGFTELTDKDYPRAEPDTSEEIDSPAGEGGKMGKHVVVDEKFGSYEPKVMAAAIRTMISKDED